jgi:hypothetical protein
MKKALMFLSTAMLAGLMMAQSTIVIRNLPDADAVAATDEIPCDQTVTSAGGQPKSCKPSQLSTFYFGQSDKVTPNLVHTSGQTDEYCLTYEATGTTWEWQVCGAGSGDVTDVWDCSTGDCNTLTIGESEYLIGGAVDGSTDPYISLPQGTDCSSVTGEGNICWDTDNDALYVGDGAAAQATGGAPAFADLTAGTNSTADMVVASGSTIKFTEGGEVESSDLIVWAQNATGSTIYKCSAVYLYDFDIPSGLPEMKVADADDATAMPATGILEADIANGASGRVIISGLLNAADTSVSEGWSAGDSVYVNDSGTSGSADCQATLTNVRPANTDDNIQKVGTVSRSHATLGKLIVSGAGRSNDVPNLQDNYFWLGNGSNVATAVQFSGDVTSANTGAMTIGNDKVLEVHLKAVNAATDEYCLTYESTTGDFEWQTCGGGSDSNAVKEVYFPASALKPGMAPDNSFPAPVHEEGTNIDLDVLAFDDTTDECAGGTFSVPSDYKTDSGNVTFRIRWYSGTADTNDAMFDFRWHEVGDNESWDGALTTEEAGAVTTAGTVDLITLDTWTEAVTTLGWAVNDVIEFLLCRDADSTGTGTDNLVGDAYVIDFAVEMVRE